VTISNGRLTERAEFRVSELELADYMIEDLRKAGWDIGEYE
jgi:hypothetical protein